jgi:hypothetical protein
MQLYFTQHIFNGPYTKNVYNIQIQFDKNMLK